MGDRAITQIITSNGSIFVYSHWGGFTAVEEAKEAILAAESRWEDESYATRIIIDQLTKPDRDSDSGAGISLQLCGDDEYNDGSPSVVIDLVRRILIAFGHGPTVCLRFEKIT